MSELLKAWLEEEVGVRVENFEQEFSSGYMFGKVFCHYNLQPDFGNFVASKAPDAMINNFTRLQPMFRKLGVPMDTRTANAVMREEPGVALKLLYSVKQSITALNQDLKKWQGSGKLGRTFGASLSPSKGLLDSSTYVSAKEAYQQGKLRMFEDILRQHAENPKVLAQTMALQRYEEAKDANQRRADEEVAAAEAAAMEAREARRNDMLNKSHNMAVERNTKLAHDKAVHAALLRRQHEAERSELAVELALQEKTRRKKLEDQLSAGAEVVSGIDAFEINLKRQAAAGDEQEAPAAPAAAGLASSKSPLEHMNKLMSMAPSPATFKASTQAYVAGIRAAQSEDAAARKEREVRRRRMLVEQSKEAAEAERLLQLDALVATLAKQSAEEQRIAARLWQLQQEEAVIEANRKLRQVQYEERKQQDWEDAVRIEVELHRSMRDEYAAAAALEMAAWREVQAQRRKEEEAANRQVCEEVAWQLVQLAERVVEYRQLSGAKVPRPEWREWLAMFHAGDPALGMPVLQPPAAPDVDPIFAKASVGEWLACTGNWERQPPIPPNAALGRAVATLSAIAHPISAQEADLPALTVPLRLAVVGAPYSGKTSLANDLARKYGVKVLAPEACIAEALAAAEEFEAAAAAARAAAAQAEAAASPPAEASLPRAASGSKRPVSAPDSQASQAPAAAPPPETTPPPVAPSVRVLLGQRLKPLLQSGQQVPDELLVEVMVAAMVACNDYMPGAEVAAAAVGGKGGKKGDAGAKPAAPKVSKRDAAAAPTTPQGFILDGFPRSARQAQLLEKALTGLDLEAEAQLLADVSALAPPPEELLPALGRPRTSGLDAVMVLRLEDGAMTLKRALGRRVDPLTGRVYHLDFDPPPKNEPGLSERLKQVEHGNQDSTHVNERLVAHMGQAAALDDWLRKFIKLRRPIEGGGSMADTLTSAAGVVDSVLRAKAAAASAKAAAAAASAAQASAVEAEQAAAAATVHVEEAAREMFNAKVAEVQAAHSLANAKKEPNAQAAEIVKAQASVKIAEHLRFCLAASKDAAGYALRAQNAAEQAEQAADKARKCLPDAEALAVAEATAKTSAQEAAKCAADAAESAARAQASREQAAQLAADAEKMQTATEAPKEPPGAGAQLQVALDEAEVGRPAAVAVPIPVELGSLLYKEWVAIEAGYLEGLALCFWTLRGERQACLRHFAAVHAGFLKVLHRPDAKPAMLAKFLADFNAMDRDLMRREESTAEQLLRSEELRDALWAACDAKMAENEAERKRIEGDSFVGDHTQLTAQHFVALLQVEVDRFLATIAFMRAYLHCKYGVTQLGQEQTGPHPDLLCSPPPPEWKDKVEDKSKNALPLPPEWGPVLSAKAPAVAVAVRSVLAAGMWARSTYAPDAESPGKKARLGSGAGAGGTGAAPAAAKKKAPSKKEEVVPDELVATVEVINAELASMVAEEVEALTGRVHLVGAAAAAYVQELAEAAGRTSGALVELVRKKYAAECSSVSALDKVVKEAALAGRPLASDIRLEEGAAVVDGAVLLYREPARPPPPPPQEPELPAGLLTCGQLAVLVAALRDAAPGGFCKLQVAADLLLRLAADGALPEGWRAASAVQMLGAVTLFDGTYTGFIDWREVVAALIAASFPSIATATCGTLANAAQALAEAAAAAQAAAVPSPSMPALPPGLLLKETWMSTELWFQEHEAREVAASGPAEEGAEGAASSSRFKRSSVLKEVLWNAFSGPPPLPELAAEGSRTGRNRSTARGASAVVAATAMTAPPPMGPHALDPQALLLYLCADRDVYSGLKKAFSVATASPAANAKASAQQVFKVAYPLGPAAGQAIGRSPVDMAAISDAVSSIYANRGGDTKQPAAITAEQLMYSAVGEKLFNTLMGRYQLKDLYIATKLV